MTALLVAVILLITMLGALASWMLKLSAEAGIPEVLRDWHFYAGGLGYATAAVLNIWVLRHMDLSVVLPLTSLTYVWTLAIGHWMLDERLTGRRVLGVLSILIGVVLIART